MGSTLAFLLDCLNLRNLSFAFFALSPFFLDQGPYISVALIYSIGYLFSVPLLFLGFSEALARFLEPIGVRRVSLAVLGMVILAILSVAVNSPDKLISIGWHFAYLLKLLVPVGCFFVLKNVFSGADLPKLFSVLVWLGLAGFAGLLITLIFQLFGGSGYQEGRYSFFFEDANMFAMFISVVFGMTFPVLLRKMIERKPYGGYIFLNFILIIQIFASGSRSGILAMMTVSVFSIAMTRNPRLIRQFAWVSLPMLVLIGSLVAFRYQATKADRSDLGRLITYEVAFNIIKDKPILGIGFGNTLDGYGKYGGLSKILLGQALSIHNTILGIFAEIGVFGAILYIIIMFVPGRGLYKRVSSESKFFYPYVEIGALNVLIVLFVCGLFLPYGLVQDNFWAYLAFPFVVWGEENGRDELSLGLLRPKLI